MKGTSPSQASRTLSGLRFTATKFQDGEANLLARRNFIVINSLEWGNQGYRNRWLTSPRTSLQSMASMKQASLLRPHALRPIGNDRNRTVM
jgi:hypothetical protein